jgi:hypothetical protein
MSTWSSASAGCPHCGQQIAEKAVRCVHCKRWVNQLRTPVFMGYFRQAIIQNWPLYLGALVFFYGVTVMLSLQALNFNMAYCLQTAFGHSLKGIGWFVVCVVVLYMWFRPLALRPGNHVFYGLRCLAIALFVLCQYGENWAVPQNWQRYANAVDQQQQIVYREMVNRHEWFGQLKRSAPFTPMAADKRRLTLKVNGYVGSFGLNPKLQHSIIYNTFLVKHQLQLPPTAASLQAGPEHWSPLYVSWQQADQLVIPDVLSWVETDASASKTADLDGIIGSDVLSRLAPAAFKEAM